MFYWIMRFWVITNKCGGHYTKLWGSCDKVWIITNYRLGALYQTSGFRSTETFFIAELWRCFFKYGIGVKILLRVYGGFSGPGRWAEAASASLKMLLFLWPSKMFGRRKCRKCLFIHLWKLVGLHINPFRTDWRQPLKSNNTIIIPFWTQT